MNLSQQEQFSKPLHELSNMPLAQWIAVESGVLRPDSPGSGLDSGHSKTALPQLKSEDIKPVSNEDVPVLEAKRSFTTEKSDLFTTQAINMISISNVSDCDEEIIERSLSQEHISRDHFNKSQTYGENIQWHSSDESVATVITNVTEEYPHDQVNLERNSVNQIDDTSEKEELSINRKRNAEEIIQPVNEVDKVTTKAPCEKSAFTTFHQIPPVVVEPIPFKKPNLITVGPGMTFRIGSKGKVVANVVL